MKSFPIPLLAHPSVPIDLILIESTNTSITIRWGTPKKKGYYPITGYFIEREGVTSARTGAYYTALATSSYYRHTFYNLIADSVYKVYVCSNTLSGRGPDATANFKTDPTPGR